MVSKLRLFRSKRQFYAFLVKKGVPKNRAREIVKLRWRGPGYYYHRGKGYWCRWNKSLDKSRGLKVGKGPWRHTHDFLKRAKPIAKKLVKVAVQAASKVARKVETKTEFVLRKTVAKKPRALDKVAKKLADSIWEEVKDKKRWKYILVYNICKLYVDICRKEGIDPRLKDLQKEVDWGLTYREAKAELLRRILIGVAKEYNTFTEQDVKAMMEDYYKSLESGYTPRAGRLEAYELEYPL